MKTERTDPHRPGAIVPNDYQFQCWYELPGAFPPGFTKDLHRLVLTGAKFFKRGPGHCDICGAGFLQGDVWLHVPTGINIHVGHNCADKYSMLADREGWLEWHAEEKVRRAIAIKERRHAKARELQAALRLAFLFAHPGLEGSLELEHPILRDLDRKLLRFGSLSEKQIALAHKLAAEIRNPKPAEVHVPAPEGRVTFKGTVVSVKEHESDWGLTTKITVKVSTDEGSWLVWLTSPAYSRAGKGDTVEITATLTRGREDFFAFGKRPRLRSEELAQAVSA